MPARSFLAPEASVPREYLQIDSAQHYYHQAQRRELREHSESYTQPSGNFRDSKKNGKTLAHPDTLGTLCGFRNVTPATGDEYERHHESQQQNSEIGEASKLGKHAPAIRELT